MSGGPSARPAPLRVAVVGAGDMGARHARHWREAGAEVAAVFDPDESRARALAAETGAEAMAPGADFEGRGLDAVSICTPTFLHARATVAALEAGAHVLCEKPISLTLPEAEAMRAAAMRAGRTLRIGFMRRFDPATQQLRAFRERIGGPVLAQATLAAGIRPKLLMHDAAANGGPIIDMCCHLFDGWAALFGSQPERVHAHGATFGEAKAELAGIDRKAVDSAHVTLEYPDGSVGQIQVSWGLPRGVEPIERHTYMGPDGLVTVDWPREVTLRDGAGTTRWESTGFDPWRAEIRALHRELTTGAIGGLGTVQDGIDALRTSLAVLASIASGEVTEVAEAPGVVPDLSDPTGAASGARPPDAGRGARP